ncbi:DUF4245 domain-containing protein [Actinacidiphila sp. DG2A-62]|uniref:DUF4245 domain-containing protein n=1 Tax=Actinacidiphila sp. DG2A-62 TaxID=3108821 RepID=UPI002DBDD617|nr:DUF4245 domain-containing protein [Actinacidiphila sp. DG2A-62]MEC3996719.1 DUF4245 domain-containing protein [Actinacidiphila sp. DG2A-62]
MGDDRGVAADKRGSKTVRDLILSLVVLGVVVSAIYLFIPHDSHADPVKVVPFSVELGQARRDAPYPVAGPEGLGADWRSTSVTYSDSDPQNVTWHIGFVDPSQQYVAVEQSNAATAPFVSSVTMGGHRDGARTVPVAGVAWQRWTGGRYSALVRVETGRTTVVMGTASQARLVQMAAALKERGGRPKAAS